MANKKKCQTYIKSEIKSDGSVKQMITRQNILPCRCSYIQAKIVKYFNAPLNKLETLVISTWTISTMILTLFRLWRLLPSLKELN